MLGINKDVIESIINRSGNYFSDCEKYLNNITDNFDELSECCKDNSLNDLIIDYDYDKKIISKIKFVLEANIEILKDLKKSYVQQDATFSSQLSQIFNKK